MGAPIGNKNGAGPRDRAFSDAIRRVVLAKDGEKLRKLATVLVDKGLSGDVTALREIADRIEGKVPQGLVGPEGGALQIEASWLGGRALAKG